MARPQIDIVDGTGWAPSQAARDCALQAVSDFADGLDSSGHIAFEMRWDVLDPSTAAGNFFEGKNPNFTYSDVLALYSTSGFSTGNAVATAFRAAMPGVDPFAATFTGGYTRTARYDALINNGTSIVIDPFTHQNYVIINSTLSWNFVPYTRVLGQKNLYAVIIHELTEGILWRRASSDAQSGSGIPVFGSYTSGGARTISNTGQHFYSYNGGSTLGFEMNTGVSGNDFIDYLNLPTGNSYFNPTGSDWCAAFGDAGTYGGSGQPVQDYLYQDAQQCACLMRMTTRGMEYAGLPTIAHGGSAPTISGTPGGILTANTGTWFGFGSITKQVWQWNRNGSPIGGATASTFNSAPEHGNVITVTESATGPIGTGTATSSGVTIPSTGGRRFRMDLPLLAIPAMAVAPIIIRNPRLSRRKIIKPW